MGWDYLDDSHIASVREHHAMGDWDKIGIQLGGKREAYVNLTRREWRILRGLMAKADIGELQNKDYENLRGNLALVVSDWILFGR